MAQELDLPERPLRIDPVVESIPDLLDRNFFLRLRIRRAAAKRSSDHPPTPTTHQNPLSRSRNAALSVLANAHTSFQLKNLSNRTIHTPAETAVHTETARTRDSDPVASNENPIEASKSTLGAPDPIRARGKKKNQEDSPDDAVRAATDGLNRRDVLGRHLEQVAEDAVLHVPPPAGAVRLRGHDLVLHLNLSFEQRAEHGGLSERAEVQAFLSPSPPVARWSRGSREREREIGWRGTMATVET